MRIVPVENYTTMSKAVASILLERIKQASKLTLGLATGGTPIQTYNYLIEDYKKNKTSYQHVSTFNLDEYIGLKSTDPNSYHYYMNDYLFSHIDIPKQNTNIPNGDAQNLQQECEAFEKKIQEHGGVDIQLLGLGSNGHIGFNEPGTPFDTSTHVVNLTEATRQANARYFNSIDEVPTQAITMGISSIMKSKEIVLLVSGEEKSKALKKLIDGEIDSSFPASILNNHEKVTIFADREALIYTDITSTMTR
ncbi:glucosamine-6-phosphate deaminase [Aquibacillus saliphilus]|uniref:glucosamine-6-phosphate deaminase n=1 Tax=Aquibacillus saliphilus TaxID=1909422 RepID=UPI001CEFFADC|nr:glucosamine-6-phosphate deaminase [Aquibacillus saliphilus]